MSTIYDDTRRRFLREGRAEGLAEGRAEGIIREKVDTAVFLISKKGYSLEDAIEIARPDGSMMDEFISMVKERLG